MTYKIGPDMATATMSAIKKTTESNELRLQTLELAMANLTNICIGLSKEIRSLRSVMLESSRIRGREEKAVIEMAHPYYSSSNSGSLISSGSKDDRGARRQTTRKPWKKDPKASPMIKVQGSKPQPKNVKANPKTAANISQKGSTGSVKAMVVKNMAPTKVKPPMATTREGLKKPAHKVGTTSVPVTPISVKGGGGRSAVSSGNGISVKLSPHIADAPTIRSLIYGSKTVKVVKSGRRPAV